MQLDVKQTAIEIFYHGKDKEQLVMENLKCLLHIIIHVNVYTRISKLQLWNKDVPLATAVHSSILITTSVYNIHNTIFELDKKRAPISTLHKNAYI